MKHLFVAMLTSVLMFAPVIGESAPGPGSRASGPSAGIGKGKPGRAAPAKRGPSRKSPGVGRSPGPGVGAPGPGARPGPGVGKPGPGVRHRAPRRTVVVVRPHGHHYHGYGHWHDDDDAWKFLAFTAITLKILDNLNEQAQREHEAAQVKATTAPVGEQITWDTGDASGHVVTTRTGTGSSGLQCREFQQEITVGGKTEQAYGTACLQEDGSWKITE